MKRYSVKSNLTGKYLTNLFEDDHRKMFQAKVFNGDKCYSYCSKLIAGDVARQLNGEAIEVEFYTKG